MQISHPSGPTLHCIFLSRLINTITQNSVITLFYWGHNECLNSYQKRKLFHYFQITNQVVVVVVFFRFFPKSTVCSWQPCASENTISESTPLDQWTVGQKHSKSPPFPLSCFLVFQAQITHQPPWPSSRNTAVKSTCQSDACASLVQWQIGSNSSYHKE